MIRQFSHDVIGWKTRVKFVISHWWVSIRVLLVVTLRIDSWLRYVDDTFTAVHKDEIDGFHDHLNEQNADIQFTKEIEENGKLPFLTPAGVLKLVRKNIS